MSQHYLFPEPGSVPGIPGLFVGVRVDVEDDGTYKVSPLSQHPHFLPAPVEEEAEAEEEQEPTPIRKKQAKTSEQKGGE